VKIFHIFSNLPQRYKKDRGQPGWVWLSPGNYSEISPLIVIVIN